ncbi:FmdE family protein [Lagierella sp.]|uniref:FmdE family protein n=1 Tax=Lagierella sp. TaxID=2849657 RepID=UPI00260544D6|nr:FmdE family protein [Lagierella sp.]
MDNEIWKKCVEFHGHECPGLAIGVRASLIAKEMMNLDFSNDEENVCITENDACGVDGVQVITGCTLGKGNLLYKDTGKMAFTFISRKTGEAIRFILKDLPKDLSKEETQNFILEAPAEEVFSWKNVDIKLPEKARKFNNIKCENCGENAPEHKIRIEDGRKLCLDCFDEYSRGW